MIAKPLAAVIVTPDMHIHICTQENASQVVDVLNQSYLENYTYLWHDHGQEYIQSMLSYGKIYQEMADPNSVFLLIHLHDKPVGIVKLNLDKGMGYHSPADALELERIYLLKEASGQGVGKAAVAYVTNLALEKGKTLIWLKAMADNTAVQFYQKQGFAITGETYLAYPQMKEEFRKMFVMCKEL